MGASCCQRETLRVYALNSSGFMGFSPGFGKPRAAAKGGGGQLEELSASEAAACVVRHSRFPALVAVVGR
jgi:hypothetical protein